MHYIKLLQKILNVLLKSLMLMEHFEIGMSTAVERLSRSGPGFDPRSGQVFWVRFFRGFSSPVRQMSGNFRPPRSPNIIWPSSSSFHIRLVGMTECVLGVYCLSCLCSLGGGPGIGLITHPGRPSMSLSGQKSMSVIHSLIPSPDGSWLCKARAAWVT